MKSNTKSRLREMTTAQLKKRFNYLKSKRPLKLKGVMSNEMKYINYHLKKRKEVKK